MKVSPGRLAAARALLDVEEGRHLDRGLERRAPDDPADRGLAWHLALGVTRRRGALDGLIAQLAKRPVQTLDPEVLTALRVGLFELHFSRTPDHAAVDQAVRLCIALRAGRAKGFVNAILRRSQHRTLDDRLTVNHPDWLVKRWRGRYGLEPTASWCAANDSEPPLCLALRSDRRPDALAGEPARAGGQEVPNTLMVAGGSPTQLPGFDDGAFWVMDPAAAATTDLLQAQAGERVLDACAAPGGKTLRLAASGAHVTATDGDAERLGRLRENLERVGYSADVRCVRWGEEQLEASFDAALVDAPCTGLGTLRRHPEIRWLRRPSDPAAMALIQAPILAAVADRVRPGGRLVYAVCSAEPEEGRDLVAGFLEDVGGWTLAAELDTAPPQHGEDGFYAARLVKAP